MKGTVEIEIPTVSIHYLMKPQPREHIYMYTGSKWMVIFQYFKNIHTKFKQHLINIKNYTAHPSWHGARTCNVSRKYSNASSMRYSAKKQNLTDRQMGCFNMSRAYGVHDTKDNRDTCNCFTSYYVNIISDYANISHFRLMFCCCTCI